MMDIISPLEINKNLQKDIEILYFEEIDSTNNYIKRNPDSPEFLTVIANSQTSGKGRMNRSFHSPQNSGIYMSILLKPKLKAENSVLITAAAAVAVSLAIESLCPQDTKIKWVNDIFINNKKVCGILTEGSLNPDGSFNYAVLGIGINAYMPKNDFPDEIKDIAGAVFNKKQENLKNRLISQIINNFLKYYNDLEKRDFLSVYRQKSLVLGKEITAPNGKALAIDIDDNCHLLVEYKNGEKEYLSSGEISIGVDFFE